MALNTIWPPPNVGLVDEKDIFGTFGEIEDEGKVDESYSEKLETESKVMINEL